MTKGGTATTNAITPAAMMRQDNPARTTMDSPVMAISMAVPRSGWCMTSTVGAAIIAAGTSSHQESLALSADRP